MKEYNMKPKHRHKRMVDEIVRQKMTKGKVNLGKAAIDAGYSESMSKTPSAITNSKGFNKVLEEAGLTDEALAQFLAEDIKGKPKDRLGELKLAMEVKGLKKEVLNVNMEKADEALILMKEIIHGRTEEV